MSLRKRKSKEAGQTLALVLVLVCILAAAALILFDLQTVIRSKIKLDIATQSGALAAANWQKETLNLIGELNLVKASTLLLAEIPPATNPYEQPATQQEAQRMADEITASVMLTSELQTRAAFIGPLIGFGAAEQAVKNNGINGGGTGMPAEIERYINKILVNQDTRYYEPVNGFEWKTPYISVLRSIQSSSALSVSPSGIFAGISNVDPYWLGREELYRAVNTENWCNPVLLRLLKTYGDEYWQSDWFKVDLYAARFPGESEIYTLDCEWYPAALEEEEIAFIKDALDRRELEYYEVPAPLTDWCFYGNSWFSWSHYYTGPDLTLWQGPERDGGGPYYYLRGNLQPRAVYGGPVAAVKLEQDIETVNAFAGTGDAARPLEKRENFEVSVSNYSVARVMGAIDGDKPPVVMPLVMPVFSETVLIPGSMMHFRFMQVENRSLEHFLIWLAGEENIYQPLNPLPGGTEYFLRALYKLGDTAWRRRGWNPHWTGGEPYAVAAAVLAGEPWPGGIIPGWLQYPVIYREINPEYPENTVVAVEKENGRTEYHYNDRFIIVRPDGSFVANEETFCREGYGGGGGPEGVQTGPGHI